MGHETALNLDPQLDKSITLTFWLDYFAVQKDTLILRKSTLKSMGVKVLDRGH